MRESLKQLITNTILFKYNLPNQNLSIDKSILSNEEDFCYSIQNNEELAKIIYNSVIEYAFREFEIKESDLDIIHRRVLKNKIKFNLEASDEQKLKYGFYGEIILYCILLIHFKSPPAIARGHFYNILENSETKGYDSYHLIEKDGCLELWFGEVKFYQCYKAAITGKNGAVSNLKKAISDDYLNKNLIAISENDHYLAEEGKNLKPVLDYLKNNPEVKILELAQKHNLKLIYPILILFDATEESYDETIKQTILHIEKECKDEKFDLSIERSLFFILIPVNNAKNIKSQVIKWISEKEPLMS